TEFSDHMAEAARKLGWHPFRPPAAINTQQYHGRPGCAYHGFCGTGGCHISAKNSTAVSTIPEAVKTKNLTIFDHAHVTRIVAGADGRVTGVSYARNGQEYFQPARVVLLASYTYENSRLLLLSKSKGYPRGLSNNHGQVGRHYFAHWGTGGGGAVFALFPFDINVFYGLPAQGVTVDNWADDSYDHSGLGFIGGTSLHVHTELHPIESAAMNTFGRAPGWGPKWKAFVHENAARWVSSYLQTSTFPYESIFLDLDEESRDPLGDPVCRITTNPKPNEQHAAEYAQTKMEEWFRTAGAIEVVKSMPTVPGISTHAYGGTRMGTNPETNVVDRWGFSHEAPNLGILGASVMGTSGARNPTLTVQALAWRTAERLVKNWKSIAG
ncbi:MAG: GMC family oxidoreductase, partial [Acidobacteriia bacterium]|nr:GMC family oxidoreductase [Terriglobia bacterium]